MRILVGLAGKKVNVFNIVNYSFLGFVALVTMYPFWDVIVSSLISFEEYVGTNIHLWPRKFDFSTYRFILKMEELRSAYGISIFVTVFGTLVNMVLTSTLAYPLAKEIRGHRIIMFLIVFTMLFSGGLIPSYMVVRNVGIMNTVWALILPHAVLTWNLIILKNFFRTIPDSLEESAKLDGCSDIGILIRIVLPLSKPALATVALFYAVGHWNDFLSAVLYISSKAKWPLQLFLRAMLFENEASSVGGSDDPSLLGAPIKMAAIVVASLPVMCIYPFFQKHFVKGILLGSVKG